MSPKKSIKFKCRQGHGKVDPLWLRIFPSRNGTSAVRPWCGACLSSLSEPELVTAISKFYPDAEIFHVTVAVMQSREQFSQVQIRYA